MRELIRPALFLVARPGLFLSVVGWSVDHVWQSVGVVDGFGGVLDQSGFGIGLDRKSTRTAVIPRIDGRMSNVNTTVSRWRPCASWRLEAKASRHSFQCQGQRSCNCDPAQARRHHLCRIPRRAEVEVLEARNGGG